MSIDKNLFVVIDGIVENINQFKNNPYFDNELNRRRSLNVQPLTSDSEVLRHLCHIVAYAHANSQRVQKMINSGVYDKVWLNYAVSAVAKLNPCDVVESHWNEINPIMSGAKAFHIVNAARAIHQNTGFFRLINECGIPTRVRTDEDLLKFWKSFNELRQAMKHHKIPFLGSVTSLLHLLLHLGFDCIKPDVIVMRVAQKLNITNLSGSIAIINP